MSLYQQAVLLFILNLLDAVLTVYWVRHGYATEGNRLMATLLELGNLPFILVKVAVGVVAAFSFWNWQEFRLARAGLTLALVLYTGVMGVHFLTGLSAAGVVSGEMIHDIATWSKSVFILFK
ncbi:MAG: hypothetical protein J5I65_10880 [Aridibacter famidurans]|nr:hypothetical protein [Aridibacter famidurans]